VSDNNEARNNVQTRETKRDKQIMRKKNTKTRTSHNVDQFRCYSLCVYCHKYA